MSLDWTREVPQVDLWNIFWSLVTPTKGGNTNRMPEGNGIERREDNL